MIVYKTRKGISMTVPEVWSMLHTMNQRYKLYCAAPIEAEATTSDQVEDVTISEEGFTEEFTRHFNGINFDDMMGIS